MFNSKLTAFTSQKTNERLENQGSSVTSHIKMADLLTWNKNLIEWLLLVNLVFLVPLMGELPVAR